MHFRLNLTETYAALPLTLSLDSIALLYLNCT
jgi:hypothetical protein